LEILEMLLSHPQANMHWKDKKQRTAIHLTAALGFQDVLEILDFHGADFNITDGSGQVPLHYAARSGQESLVRQLLTYEGTSVKAIKKTGLKPVYVAITAKSFATMRMLVAHEHGSHDMNAAFTLSAELKLVYGTVFSLDISLTRIYQTFRILDGVMFMMIGIGLCLASWFYGFVDFLAMGALLEGFDVPLG
jgi:hypothetical protein